LDGFVDLGETWMLARLGAAWQWGDAAAAADWTPGGPGQACAT